MKTIEVINFRLDQFEKFHKCLMKNAPEGYTPWYFPVRKDGKDPDGRAIYARASELTCCVNGQWIKRSIIILGTESSKTVCSVCGKTRGSWKQSWARLDFEEAYDYIRQGYNIGIAARADDPLTIIDIDNYSLIGYLPDTLKTMSRKRCGIHAFVFNYPDKDKIPNIPTENDGEVRSLDQYTVCAGSYVPTSKEEIVKEIEESHITQQYADEILKDERLGFYTVHNESASVKYTFDDLPDFFKKQYEQDYTESKPGIKSIPIQNKDKHSALFDLKMCDILDITPDLRVSHPSHDTPSKTNANFYISSANPELCHCWRHSVSLNAIQFLAVRSGYMGCNEAGTGHKSKNKSRKQSKVKGNNGAIFYAWLQAKKDHLIPDDDPMPSKAMQYIAINRGLINVGEEHKIYEADIYNKILEIVENEF